MLVSLQLGREVKRIGALLEPFNALEAECSNETNIAHGGLRRSFLPFFYISALVFTYTFKLWFLTVLVAAFLALQSLRKVRAARKKVELFDRDYPIFLMSVASAVRAGRDPLSAVVEVSDTFSEETPLGIELRVLKSNIRRGMRELEAVSYFGASLKYSELALFKSALKLSLSHGAAIADALHRLARVCRQRQSFRRKIRSALALQRLSSVGIAISACAIAAIQFASNPKGIALAWNDPNGALLLRIGLLLVIVGLWWMTRLGREFTAGGSDV